MFAANPTLVGAITVLIAAVAVFLAYNANHGLPFVATYRISAVVPNAQSLVPGNEVRIGGVRVGQVDSVEPKQNPNTGRVDAKIDMKLDSVANPVPDNSTVVIRAKSALGLKYVEINKGSSRHGYPAGGTIPVSHARPPTIDIDQVLRTFNPPTRLAIRHNLVQFGNTLAGRGNDINEAIGALKPLVTRLTPVMKTLGSPRTGLAEFFRAAEATASEVAPVAETQARMFTALDVTFGAFARVARPFIQETISKTPATLDVGDRALPQIRPFLAHSAVLFGDLRPGVHALAGAAPTLSRALKVGIPALQRSPQLNAEIPPTARALFALSQDSSARAGIDRLITSNNDLAPLLRFVTPAQTVCNYGTLLFRNAASGLSLGDGEGTWQRFILFQTPFGKNNLGSPSSKPANGGGSSSNFLHVNPYPNTAAPGQTHECEAGNAPYVKGKQAIGNVTGNQGTHTAGQP
jgi:phospholipid/cholesterol/gamma-HCH transport system substrate-binding protein